MKKIKFTRYANFRHPERSEGSLRRFFGLRPQNDDDIKNLAHGVKFITLFFVFLICTSTLYAESETKILSPKGLTSLETFKHIAVLENGRIKPMDTYARNILLQLSGKTTFDRKEAINWLAKLLFAPETTKEDKIFLINNPDIADALGIAAEKSRRYSFTQLEPHLDRLSELATAAQGMDPKQRDLVENELVRVYDNVKLYASLSLSFSFAFPNPDFTIKNSNNLYQLNLPLNVEQFTFIDLAQRADLLQKLTKPLELKLPEKWTPAEKEIILVVNNLYQWAQNYHQLPPTIIPAYSSKEEVWISPWDAIGEGLSSVFGRKELLALGQLPGAYWNGKQIDFDMAARTFTDNVEKRLVQKEVKQPRHIGLELLFNQLNLFFTAKIFYFLSFLTFLISLVISNKNIRIIGWSAIILAFLPHALALICRIIILERPPVSNLYETFIFVGFVTALVGIIIELIYQQWIGIVISSICGFTFLTIASKFSVEGDTLQMLVAVLNSNFWLGTHVLSITIGYAGTCVAGVVGHIYLLQAISKPKDKKRLETTYHILIGALGFALTMAFLGTNLGGIWADQSWGRFWGWDPKENGALLIILWIALLFHLRVGKMIGPLGLAVGSAASIMVVMWAWFGVNLLSIGLHSYGFTSGLATNLIIYGIIQILFIVIVTPMAYKKLQSTKL